MAGISVERFATIILSLKPGEAQLYHWGYIAAERKDFMSNLKFDRLSIFTKMMYHLEYIEIFTKKIQPMEYRYYVRRRKDTKDLPEKIMLEVAKELDKDITFKPWLLEAMQNKLELAYK